MWFLGFKKLRLPVPPLCKENEKYQLFKKKKKKAIQVPLEN